MTMNSLAYVVTLPVPCGHESPFVETVAIASGRRALIPPPLLSVAPSEDARRAIASLRINVRSVRSSLQSGVPSCAFAALEDVLSSIDKLERAIDLDPYGGPGSKSPATLPGSNSTSSKTTLLCPK